MSRRNGSMDFKVSGLIVMAFCILLGGFTYVTNHSMTQHRESNALFEAELEKLGKLGMRGWRGRVDRVVGMRVSLAEFDRGFVIRSLSAPPLHPGDTVLLREEEDGHVEVVVLKRPGKDAVRLQNRETGSGS